MAVAMIGPKFYAWDRNGKPLAFGKLFTYQARTNTPKVTYQSEDQVVENSNPVILNGEGYADVYLDGSYKMVLKDDKDNEIWSSDPVTAQQAEEWVNCLPATYLSPTSVRVAGNFVAEYDEGRRVRIDNNTSTYSYSQVVSASYAGGFTTIIILDPVITTQVKEICSSLIGPNSFADGRDLVFNFSLLDEARNAIFVKEGNAANVKERETGVGNGAMWDYVPASTVTVNGNNIVSCLGVPSLALVQREVTVDKYVHSLEVNSSSLDVGLLKNRAGSNQDRWIMLFGDSHSWGQGAPDWDFFSGLTNWSRHSSYPHNKGYMERFAEFIRNKLQIQENVYSLGNPQTEGRLTTPDVKSRNMIDIEATYPLQIQSGLVTSTIKNLADITANTCTQFFGPIAQQDTDSYSLTEYREKSGRGLFKNSMMTMALEGADSFSPQGKDYFIELVPDADYAGSGAGFTQITYGSENTIVAEYNNTTGAFYVVTKQSDFPEWVKVGEDFFLPGYGVVEIANIVGNGAIQIKNINGSEIGAAGAALIYPGIRLYQGAYGRACSMRIDLDVPVRAQYVHVRHKENGGKLRLAWVDSISNGCAMRGRLNSGVSFRDNSNPWTPGFTSGLAQVSLVGENHELISASPSVAIDSFGVVINTAQRTPGVDEEVIYRIDWASKQIGSVYFEMTENDPGDTVETRGTIFDNNKVSNFAMGAHTVGAFIGRQSSNAGETRDHVADILNYTPIQPSHVITQIPFVNEYIKQNSTAIFKQDLKDFIDRFKDHLSTSNNYNTQGVDFIFFTSLRNREIAFEGGSEASVTYDDYVQAAKEFCEDNNCAFVDCEQRLFDLVEQGRIDYQRLFNDSNHPSDYANEMIFEALKTEFLYAQVG